MPHPEGFSPYETMQPPRPAAFIEPVNGEHFMYIDGDVRAQPGGWITMSVKDVARAIEGRDPGDRFLMHPGDLSAKAEPDQPLAFMKNRVIIDEQARQLVVDKAIAPLREKPYTVLVYLAHNAGKLATNRQIYDACWDEAWYSLAPGAIRAQIRHIRRALTPKYEGLIQTRRSRGYMLQDGLPKEP